MSRRRTAMLETSRPARADESWATGPATGGFAAPPGSRAGRRKRGLFRRIGVVPPAIGLAALLVAVVYFAANMMSPGKSGANGMADFIDGLGNSGSAALLVQERQNIIDMSAAAKTLTVASKPVTVDAAQMMNPSSSSTTGGGTASAPVAPANPTGAEAIGKAMLPSFGFNQTTQWDCLYNLWMRESGWNVYAENAISGAYGIPQSLPGSKMASAGSDWQTNPATQIKWGLGYISSVYGTPCGAWSHEQSAGFY